MISQNLKCKIKIGSSTVTRDIVLSGYSYKSILESKLDYEKSVLKENPNAIITWIE